ncbi:MAG: type III secretion system chaperone [Succinivibrio sp.]|nr:type III secretion system chaperone [Succinivibrio sp.]
MDWEQIVQTFGERLGVGLTLNERRECSFEADGARVTILSLSELEQIVLIGDVGAAPPERLENLFRIMLEGNHLFGATAGATLSYDAAQERFALCRCLDCRVLDAEGFLAQVELFINTLHSWISIVSNYRGALPELKRRDNVEPDQQKKDALSIINGAFMPV